MENVSNAERTPMMEIDIEAELACFEAEERKRLGLNIGGEHWRDRVAGTFTAGQRPHTTILVCGLTLAHDLLIEAALAGLGYRVKHLDVPDNEALRFGKEFGNRAQCNPTYYTVGNLVKYLTCLRDETGLSAEEIIGQYVYITVGTCGPCRFGMYATEYRKALRDAGFDGFRVMLFQQQGGLRQATGERAGLELSPRFCVRFLFTIVAGDALNAIRYRLRPYEVVPGSTDEAVERSQGILCEALRQNRSLVRALLASRRQLASVRIDRTIVKPKVSILGEFWAMTTEGDGNCRLQRFLEQEGAEVDVQLVTAWALFVIWSPLYDTQERMFLRGRDTGKKSLKDPARAARNLLLLRFADKALRASFQGVGRLMGLESYRLPDMDAIAGAARDHYDLNLRGGEAYMEVGKHIHTVKEKKATMVVSVKPFGCMPSSGVSDGVQSIITEKHPGAIFLPIETTGDGAVSVHSRVQMMLFKARQAARREIAEAYAETGLTPERVRRLQEKLPWLRRALHHAPHRVSTTAANFVYEAARWERRIALLKEPWKLARQSARVARRGLAARRES